MRSTHSGKSGILAPYAQRKRMAQMASGLELKDKGDYEGAREVMRPFWKHFGDRPEVEGLNTPMVAEVLLHVGILTRWIGSKNQISDAQDEAKDLISESITLFESLGDVMRVSDQLAPQIVGQLAVVPMLSPPMQRSCPLYRQINSPGFVSARNGAEISDLDNGEGDLLVTILWRDAAVSRIPIENIVDDHRVQIGF